MTKIINGAQQLFARLGRDEEGATAVEYAVMLAVVLGVAAATLLTIGDKINAVWVEVATLLDLIG
ncbi:Flp family type IVb pilin [Microvirga massiliensis]|uniref:Flp family type IVb pilin n=1 Tax=Microvirga massiliensis TaxID=1033741 RepID=UPI00062BC958|nr:Flp family type IVb pilin [Microvirga massiliensis]